MGGSSSSSSGGGGGGKRARVGAADAPPPAPQQQQLALRRGDLARAFGVLDRAGAGQLGAGECEGLLLHGVARLSRRAVADLLARARARGGGAGAAVALQGLLQGADGE